VFRRRPSRLGEAAPQALAPVAPAAPAAVAPVVPAALAVAAPVLAPVAEVPAMPAPMVQVQLAPAQLAAALAAAPAAAVAAAPAPATILASADTALMAELQSLRLSLSDRLTNLEAQLAPKPEPARAAPEPVAAAAAASVPASVPAPAVLAPALALKRRAMTRLIMSGFSPELARRIGEAVPADLDPKDADNWLQDLLARQLRCPAEADNPLFAQGAVALVGPTGVGKTTTAAKLAARFVVRHGAASLGLITLDSYRMGAHEQLRSYGRILGVPVQIAHDAATLRDQLAACTASARSSSTPAACRSATSAWPRCSACWPRRASPDRRSSACCSSTPPRTPRRSTRSRAPGAWPARTARCSPRSTRPRASAAAWTR